MNKEQIKTDTAPAAIGPYAQAVKTGAFIYTSGQIAIDPATGEIVTGGIEAQTVRVMENLIAVLNAAGVGLKDVVKTTVFIKDMNQFGLINEMYSEVFGDTKPARVCVEVARLPKDANVEIDAIAVV